MLSNGAIVLPFPNKKKEMRKNHTNAGNYYSCTSFDSFTNEKQNGVAAGVFRIANNEIWVLKMERLIVILIFKILSSIHLSQCMKMGVFKLQCEKFVKYYAYV